MGVYSQLIKTTADNYRLDPYLVAGIIIQESGGYAYASRFEPKFFKRHYQWLEEGYLLRGVRLVTKLIGLVPREVDATFVTELHHRASSFGLMQILGSTARENGFVKVSLAELFDPAVNLEVGCKLLAKFLAIESGSVLKALRRWNNDPSYGPKVINHMSSSRAHDLLDG